LENNKTIHNNQVDIILEEQGRIVNKQNEVADIFNNFFVNVAKHIGSNSRPINDEHPSLQAITKNRQQDKHFTFQPVDEDFINKQFNKINPRKATGHDNISPKLLRLAQPSIIKPVTTLVNLSLTTSTFTDTLKTGQVRPIHKKNSTLEKGHYRPVSILPAPSKVFERSIHSQLSDFFDGVFHPYLSAFRAGYGCQTALLRVIEDWTMALSQNKYVGCILMDLSKAFDCLLHNLLLLKL